MVESAKESGCYITTPIYYVNDVPHIGHAYTSLACDVLARFHRSQRHKTFFLTGTDEHGLKVETSARKAGMKIKDFTDQVSGNFQRLVQELGCSNDDFIRTTQSRHIKAAQHFWRVLEEKGEIYIGRYRGWYCMRDENFVAESDVIKGDNDTHTTTDGAPLQWLEEDSYFFRLSQWQEKLLEFYRTHPHFIAPETRRNEVIRFVEGGLHDLSVSRTGISWGIPVPSNASHVIYVWIDALTNYLSALGYPNTEEDSFQQFWPADVHVIGKDILRFHAVYWPALLMAAGIEPPKQIFAHGWWTNEGKKISKSLGNVIDPFALIDTWGQDAIRYFLMREVPFGMDGDFSRQALRSRFNGDLVHGLGNLAQRVLTLIQKNCAGIVPDIGAETSEDRHMKDALHAMPIIVGRHIENLAFSRALEEIWRVIAAANRYIDAQAPWRLKKEDPQRMATVLHILYDVLRRLSVILAPFLPTGMKKLSEQLAIPEGSITLADSWPAVPSGLVLPPPAILYPRAE